jgi:two-component sensor histidine kinase
MNEAGTQARIEALEAELERERARSREIDHRARNSLQLAGSLLLLMGRRAADPGVQASLKSLHQRIGAIGAVHHGFIDSPEPHRFDFTRHLREHMATLARGAPEGATLELDLDPVIVPTNAAVPLALIANELASNALNHGGPAPRVRVTLRRQGHGCRLTVQDAGPGLPEGAGGFGLTVVRLLAQQLRADLAFEDAQPGLRAVVTAPCA